MLEDLRLFDQISVSYLSSHRDLCCEIARMRLLAILDIGSAESALAAIPEVIRWSPVRWPMHWCDLYETDDSFKGDCGVHAALAAEILDEYRINFTRTQIAIMSTDRKMEHWRSIWVHAGMAPAWIGATSVYHEVLAVDSRFWDPSEARWFTGPGTMIAAGRVAAIKLIGEGWVIDDNSRPSRA